MYSVQDDWLKTWKPFIILFQRYTSLRIFENLHARIFASLSMWFSTNVWRMWEWILTISYAIVFNIIRRNTLAQHGLRKRIQLQIMLPIVGNWMKTNEFLLQLFTRWNDWSLFDYFYLELVMMEVWASIKLFCRYKRSFYSNLAKDKDHCNKFTIAKSRNTSYEQW